MYTKSKYNSDRYINKKYNKLTIVEYLSSNDNRNNLGVQAFLCRCDCGELTLKNVRHVINNVAKCCDKCKTGRSKYNNEDIISKQFGALTVIEYISKSDSRNIERAPAYLCKCQCGNTVIKKASHIINGNIRSCGMCHCTRSKYSNSDFIGKKFGKLTVVDIGHNEKENTFICNCECGRSNNTEYSASMVYNGYINKCKICSKEVSLESLNTKRYNNTILEGLIGRKFGKLTIKSIYKDTNGTTIARCDCECGTKDKDVWLANILKRGGGTKACGNCRIAPNHKYDNDEYIGKTFNFLTVLGIEKIDGKTYWNCKCNLCGNTRKISAYSVITGNNKSCGCMQSYGEAIIEKVLTKNKINYRKQVTFQDLHGIRGGILRFDFGIYSNDNKLLLLIEYDGDQHFNDINENYYITEYEIMNNINIVKENDKIKNEYCIKNNLNLARYNGTISEEIFTRKLKETVKSLGITSLSSLLY